MKRHLRSIMVILFKVRKELLIGAKNAAWAISR